MADFVSILFYLINIKSLETVWTEAFLLHKWIEIESFKSFQQLSKVSEK